MMNINTQPKDEVLSHTAEIISDQEQRITQLEAETKVLVLVALVLAIFAVV